MFHRRFIHCVIEAKENSQNAPRLEIDFVLNFAFYFTMHDPDSVTRILL